MVKPLKTATADVAEVTRQLIGQRIAVTLRGLKPAVVHLPVLRDDVLERNAVIICRILLVLIHHLSSLIHHLYSLIHTLHLLQGRAGVGLLRHLFPRPVVLICLLRSCGDILFAPALTLTQQLIFSLALLCRHWLREKTIVQIRQIIIATAGREYHPLQVLRAGVHFHFQNCCHAHLILQNSSTPAALTHQVPTAAGAAFQHPQTYLVLLLQNETLDALRMLAVIAIHIVKEITAHTLTTRHMTIHIAHVISQLQQLTLSLPVTLTSLAQIAKILL